MNFLTSILRMILMLLSFILTMRWSCVCTTSNDVNYTFGYAVEAINVGVVTHHWEERTGGFVKGEYSFLDSDGRIRIVGYQVEGDRGFQAAVTFRKPGGNQVRGHLSFPKHYRHPVKLHHPVSLITADLLNGIKQYPHLSSY